jgi:hypothetical protein
MNLRPALQKKRQPAQFPSFCVTASFEYNLPGRLASPLPAFLLPELIAMNNSRRLTLLRGSTLVGLGMLALLLAAPSLRLKAATGQGTGTTPEAFFETQIRPILQGTCFKCHGGEKVRGGLRLDSRAALLKGGESGPALVPGDVDRSLLIQALRYTHEEIKMPPGKPLPAPAVADFVRWVKEGAVWPEKAKLAAGKNARRWPFVPLRPVLPPPDPSGCAAGEIDRFILARLREKHLTPARAADRPTLLRRATFDLIGLPPTPEDLAAFLADDSPRAFEKVVDRLLASPHYGERWGRHWLDVVRYADTGGFEGDYLYPNAWRFRDYVIASFNADKPFDRFLQEQIAGEELWPDDKVARQATALYCVGPALAESAMVGNQLEYEWLSDVADTTGAALLGLTLGCARCHDHKYDPISQRDYFSLQAIFAASDRPFPGKMREVRIKALNGLLSEAKVPPKVLKDPRCTVKTEETIGFHLFHREQPLTIHLLHRGELTKPRQVLGPAVPAVLADLTPPPDWVHTPLHQRRATFARWLTRADNPLTARVLVNRVWGWHFGQAIVRTPNDFGAQGEPPTHPDLLDWLASDFTASGWSLKHLHRRIMLSKTYQRQSIADPMAFKIDPENRLLARFPRHRLEGEAIRDAMLACAATLNGKTGGPAVVPALNKEELAGLFDARGKWPVTKDPTEHTRASVYLLVRRTFTYPLFAVYDPPEVMVSCPQRMRTVVPTQALTLLNSPLVQEQAAAFAKRLLAERAEPAALVGRAWKLAFGREIRQAERERALAFLRTRSEFPGSEAVAELCLALFNSNEFLYVD